MALTVGCGAQEGEAVEVSSRFTMEKAGQTFRDEFHIITDTETGEQYLYIDGTYGCAMVKLEYHPDEVVDEEYEPEHPYAKEAKYMAKAIYGEARGYSKTEQAAVAWCILNRVDSDDPYYPDDIISVILQKNQFTGYKASHPVTQEHYELALDVIERWKTGGEGRVLPEEYLWFKLEDGRNTFRDAFSGNYETWDWSLPSPY